MITSQFPISDPKPAAKGRFIVQKTETGQQGGGGTNTNDSTPSPANSNYTTASESGTVMNEAMVAPDDGTASVPPSAVAPKQVAMTPPPQQLMQQQAQMQAGC